MDLGNPGFYFSPFSFLSYFFYRAGAEPCIYYPSILVPLYIPSLCFLKFWKKFNGYSTVHAYGHSVVCTYAVHRPSDHGGCIHNTLNVLHINTKVLSTLAIWQLF